MRFRTLCFTLLLALLSLIRDFSRITTTPNFSSEAIQELRKNGNSESLLALGEKLSLSKVEMFDLELIPGLGDALAESILVSRQLVKDQAKARASAERYRSFEVIHGIGPKKAKLLASKIDALR